MDSIKDADNQADTLNSLQVHGKYIFCILVMMIKLKKKTIASVHRFNRIYFLEIIGLILIIIRSIHSIWLYLSTYHALFISLHLLYFSILSTYSVSMYQKKLLVYLLCFF